MTKEKISPGMQQYLDIKAQHPDAFLLFRMGDFYELFYEDAVEAAQILELTLTSRNKNAAWASSGGWHQWLHTSRLHGARSCQLECVFVLR